MQRKRLVLFGFLILVMGLSIACSSGRAAAPANTAPVMATATPAAAPSAVRATSPAEPAAAEENGATIGYEAQSVEGGSVVVEVMPLALKIGSPSEFEIAMNTHSVDLSNDMLKAVVLRDDTGKEYAPARWDGPDGGGHHRLGKIEFPALASGAKSVTLIVKGIASVPERIFTWEIHS